MLLLPGVVWFGEVPMDEIAQGELNWCDFLLCWGRRRQSILPLDLPYRSTLEVQGTISNPDRSAGDELADFLLLGNCAETWLDVFNVKKEVRDL
ncbi:hypothetical protein Hypma_005223 [Hypsizygus marmoreus]|uniref:Uncharacterized protein n=1 Tax=Hypsizygus marmoreus TaxID=39966 RepID=A0A369J132_HYPMA|nr:hypothetical protein Hypma_005223 [Hypsizygus marmoreus]